MRDLFKKTILIIFILVLCQIIFLIFKTRLIVLKSSEPVVLEVAKDKQIEEKVLVEDNKPEELTRKDIRESDYLTLMAKKYSTYLDLIDEIQASSTISEDMETLINQLKDDVEETIVPDVKFKKSHLNFILSLAKMGDYIKFKNEANLRNSLDLVKKIELDYGFQNQ